MRFYFQAKFLPKRKSSSLKSFEISKIIFNTKKILKKSIRFGGSSIRDFKNMQEEAVNFNKNSKFMENLIKTAQILTVKG